MKELDRASLKMKEESEELGFKAIFFAINCDASQNEDCGNPCPPPSLSVNKKNFPNIDYHCWIKSSTVAQCGVRFVPNRAIIKR